MRENKHLFFKWKNPHTEQSYDLRKILKRTNTQHVLPIFLLIYNIIYRKKELNLSNGDLSLAFFIERFTNRE